jgi:hypothetical protein
MGLGTSEAGFRLSGYASAFRHLAVPASAETVTIPCDADPAFNSPAMTFVYDGEAEGTMSITAPFGEIRLPSVTAITGCSWKNRVNKLPPVLVLPC